MTKYPGIHMLANIWAVVGTCIGQCVGKLSDTLMVLGTKGNINKMLKPKAI